MKIIKSLILLLIFSVLLIGCDNPANSDTENDGSQQLSGQEEGVIALAVLLDAEASAMAVGMGIPVEGVAYDDTTGTSTFTAYSSTEMTDIYTSLSGTLTETTTETGTTVSGTLNVTGASFSAIVVSNHSLIDSTGTITVDGTAYDVAVLTEAMAAAE